MTRRQASSLLTSLLANEEKWHDIDPDEEADGVLNALRREMTARGVHDGLTIRGGRIRLVRNAVPQWASEWPARG